MSAPATARRLIVNADDFGWSEAVSAGILHAHANGIVSSTTLMANMPASAASVTMLPQAPRLGVGVHLNVCQGRPLCRAMACLAGPDGMIDLKAGTLARRFLWSPRVRRAVAAEMEAQIVWALEHGLQPTHLDSHRHVHALPPIFAIVCRLAKRYKIPWIRWLRPGPCSTTLPPEARPQGKTARLLGVMMRLNAARGRPFRGTEALYGIPGTGFLSPGMLVDLIRHLPAGVNELMVHPGWAEQNSPATTRLAHTRPAELAALCDAAVRAELEAGGIELIQYGNLAARDG